MRRTSIADLRIIKRRVRVVRGDLDIRPVHVEDGEAGLHLAIKQLTLQAGFIVPQGFGIKGDTVRVAQCIIVTTALEAAGDSDIPDCFRCEPVAHIGGGGYFRPAVRSGNAEVAAEQVEWIGL